ncbi:MAG: homocysteine S-methyltransferase family protein [Acidobacteriaceae bacterium]|nr:homocysteine S-methyltransferase family protein [Acidobacteriaceae bacterium]
MPREKIVSVAKSRVLVSDGAWGTFLYKKGLQPGECPEEWCLSHFDGVKEIAASYIAAGADMVETNSFGGTCFKLKPHGLETCVAAINEAAARASREAAGADHWVIASMGPTGKMLVTEEVTEKELYAAFKEQAVALEKGGADAVCIETMSDIGEAVEAIKAVRENTSLEVICTFTFERTAKGSFRTMMGVTPERAARAAVEAGADIVGANCGNGFEAMIEIVKEIRAALPAAPILVHANAGLPKTVDGHIVFPESPEDMAGRVNELVSAGANIIGGCCGTTPEHIKAIKEELSAEIRK